MMPSGRWVTVMEHNHARDTYICMLDPQDIDGHEQMSKRELMEARFVEFTAKFLVGNCKEKK